MRCALWVFSDARRQDAYGRPRTAADTKIIALNRTGPGGKSDRIRVNPSDGRYFFASAGLNAETFNMRPANLPPTFRTEAKT